MTLVKYKGETTAALKLYRIIVDGFTIGTILLPDMSQDERDEYRREIAKEYQVPRHYIRLFPAAKNDKLKKS